MSMDIIGTLKQSLQDTFNASKRWYYSPGISGEQLLDQNKVDKNYYDDSLQTGVLSSAGDHPLIVGRYVRVPGQVMTPEMISQDSISGFAERSWAANRAVTAELDKALSPNFNAQADKYKSLMTVPGVKEFIDQHRGASIEEKMDAVNKFVNDRVEYLKDGDIRSNYIPDYSKGGELTWIGRIDDFRTSTEILNSGTGDCDDYAIAKYDLLAAMGVDESRLQIIVGATITAVTPDEQEKVNFLERGKGVSEFSDFSYKGYEYGMHAMLLVDHMKESGTFSLLDNDVGNNKIIDQRTLRILPDTFIPIAGFNKEGQTFYTTSREDDPIHKIKEHYFDPHSRDIRDFYQNREVPEPVKRGLAEVAAP